MYALNEKTPMYDMERDVNISNWNPVAELRSIRYPMLTCDGLSVLSNR